MYTCAELKKEIRNIIRDIGKFFLYPKNIPMRIIVGPLEEIKFYEGCDPEDSAITSMYISKNFNGIIREFILAFNHDIWKTSIREEVAGCVSHELQHIELNSSFSYLNDILSPNIFGKYPLEMVIDTICIQKGFGENLLKARRFIMKRAKHILGWNISEDQIHDLSLTNGLDLHDYMKIYNNSGNLHLIQEYFKK